MIPDDAWPAGDRLTWVDDDARLVWDFTTDPHTSTPYTEAENAAADERARLQAETKSRARLQQQLRDGVNGLEEARAAALRDQRTAQALRTQALGAKAQADAQRTTVGAFIPSAVYQPIQLAAVRDAIATVVERQALILQALADLYEHREAVDINAVTTDDALLWLARLVSGALNESEEPQ